ncbi:MAG: acyl-CoA dehydratase activase-related protein [Eubacteriales bacterium]|nr:acyl-CoA dehydratase activase-related protein [Eubacteriales bacterium]
MINKLGIDIGSTTVKLCLLNEDNKIIFSEYKRHLANISECLISLLEQIHNELGDVSVKIVITGSGGLSLSNALNTDFMQEVVSVSTALKFFAPQTNCAIELGGEDAKIIYFDGKNVDQRMNGICAGGTGSFIDQMASLLKTDPSGLNNYAKNYHMIYPIAARCGVFAKSDIQPLINEGATKEDLSASIFQAVVSQTISGLACGKPIRGNIAFLGGPLHFLSELKESFIRTLNLDKSQVIDFEFSHLFAAIGSAMRANNDTKVYNISSIITSLKTGVKLNYEIKRLSPLFDNNKEYDEFKERHSKAKIEKQNLQTYSGDCFLGFDAGSTTTKLALISSTGKLLYSFYESNKGQTIDASIRAIKNLKENLPKSAIIKRACSTGYGEHLLKAALHLDYGEVETIAHFNGAIFFDKNVDCILDIGGQDMKYIKIKDGYVENVLLNEACSSGCGSFIETFALSLGYDVKDFATKAIFAKNPIDLGTRCTVFMNSNVKQAQKEGANTSDISAGLSYSVIKNALYKVIKINDASSLGEHIVVQGGTFYNDSVLRALEKILNKNVICPDIAGIMGAFGAALIAKNKYEDEVKNGKDTKSTMLSLDEIINLKYDTKMTHCKGCTNSCVLTINTFSKGSPFISGNRCEKGLGKEKKNQDVPNLFEYKMNRIFDYEPLSIEKASRGIIGIPRVLNMYENFPFWATFFKELKYKVLLSPISTRKIYEMGIESIPSESECYPAKLVHGHIEWLINNGADFIFMPCIPYERNETKDAQNHYNCPMVTSYAENIKNNVENLHIHNIKFYNPFLPFTDEITLIPSMIQALSNKKYFPEISIPEIMVATHLAWSELEKVKKETEEKGKQTIEWIEKNNKRGIVLAGRPYHLDPEVHHGIPDLIQSYGFAVLTEDSISSLSNVERPLLATDQWMYHSRLYRAAEYVKKRDDLDLIQLNSFGCGLDAVTSDQVQDILVGSNKIYTLLKIDEVNNIGSARIRIRSLISAISNNRNKNRKINSSSYKRVIFTEEMKKNYTLLAPQMSPIHFDLLEPALNSCGYHVEILQNTGKKIIDTGLRYVNNDACYPSTIVVGQFMDALLSGKYDLNKVGILMSQTGGGCRASNYVGFIRRALRKANMDQIPVISINLNGMEKNPGFSFSFILFAKAIQALLYGDIFMRIVYATRPYEKVKGSTNALHEKWKKICIDSLTKDKISLLSFNKNIIGMIRDFDNLERIDIKKPKVGVVGEILVKFSPLANNKIVDLLEKEGAEAVMPDLLDFFLYAFYNQNFRYLYLGGTLKSKIISNIGIKFLERLRFVSSKELSKSKHFSKHSNIKNLASSAKKYVSLGNQTGEGWFLTAEMLELIEEGVCNIVCTQPFGCLPNHIVGKGVIKEIKKDYEDANIVAIDYDPSASEVNQLNRIKLMLQMSKENL